MVGFIGVWEAKKGEKQRSRKAEKQRGKETEKTQKNMGTNVQKPIPENKKHIIRPKNAIHP